MAEPFKQFWEIAQDNNIEKTLQEAPQIETTLNKLERLGKDIGETALRFFKKEPQKPSGPTPTYQESALLKPHKETTLYNVTNREQEVPTISKASKIFKNASYSVKGFSVAATHKEGKNAYSLIAGEKVGFNYTNDTPYCDRGLSATFKVRNHKSSVEYFSRNPVNSYRVALFNQDTNFGVTGHYSNHKGFSTSVSIDKNSAAGECSYNKNGKMYKMQLGAYATTGENYSNPFIGVRGRITF